ncbi:MAG: methionine biosynthesis protein MetW [Propionibacteriaceae bacterium]|nr:methionine biosynthesis protein MetW [Micropruina sp.]HBX79948.1 methionine biosynthesis protein MetW [Propionibacteriaceae bacterium]HBY22375.1 methionine biosynthesis protein MetW [Propionibacteriaceae bacterium]
MSVDNPLRSDLAFVAHLIERGTRVLDLGCGTGELLAHLIGAKACHGTGVEIDPDAVLTAIRRGVPVIELDLDSQMAEFADDSYDTVVLSRTIQTIRQPRLVLSEMARVGHRLIVSIPNFGWWGNRLRLLRGRMPMSTDLPYSWYDTPNLRFTTLAELEELFAEIGLRMEQRITFNSKGVLSGRNDPLSNLMASSAVYVLVPA